METIIDNWYIILGFIAVIVAVVYAIYHFFHLPTKEQLEKVKEWLKIAVLEAEKELGSGTGQAKLSYVYDLFVARFPSIAKILPFATFSKLVDEALDWLNNQLSTNPYLKEIVKNEN